MTDDKRDPSILFSDARESLSWGHQGIAEINERLVRYFQEARHEFLTEFDAQTNQNIYKFKIYDPVPRDVVRRTKETLEHIRGSLDQAIYATRQFTIGPNANEVVHFPLATSPSDLEQRLRKKDIPPLLHSAIRSFEPYFQGTGYIGGNDAVRQMLQIAGKKKHTIHLVVAANIAFAKLPDYAGPYTGPMNLRLPIWNTEKNEVEIARYTPGTNLRHNAQLGCTVSFDETGALKGVPVVDGLLLCLQQCQGFVKAAERECWQHG